MKLHLHNNKTLFVVLTALAFVTIIVLHHFLLSNSYDYVDHARLEKNKLQYLTDIKNLPDAGGYRFKAWDWGRRQTLVGNPYEILIYDESDEISTPNSRTEKWYAACRAATGARCSNLNFSEKLSEHFYLVPDLYPLSLWPKIYFVPKQSD